MQIKIIQYNNLAIKTNKLLSLQSIFVQKD
jgi:hypothetical protein